MQESVEQLLLKLNELKIGVKLQEDELKLSIHKGTDASSVIPEVRALKQDLINYISERQQNSQPSLEGLVVVPAQAAYALSGAQKRMFFLDQFEPDSISYNISQVLKFTGAIDVNRLKNSFRMLVGRHEILRSYYVLEADGVVQKVDDAPEFDVEEIEKGDQDIETLVRNFIRPFDLSSAPLIRAGLVKLRTDESLLLIDMHHIVSDGVSSNILVQDFFGYYQGLEPAPLSFQYKDYAEWQQTPVYAKRIERQRNFWLEQFADPIDPLVLPYDFPRPAVKSFEGNTLTFRFDERLSKQINELASRERCTPFMTVLSIFKVMLYKLSGQDELVVGTHVAGRTLEELREIVWMFVNNIAIKNTIDSSQTFQEFLASLKQNTLSCFNNQGYQYETLVEDLQLERSTSRNSLFDVMFSFNNFELSDVSLSDIRIEPVSFDTKISKFDLTLTGFEAEGQFTFSLEYAADLFTKQTVQTFITYFEKIALMVTTTPEVKLAAIGLLSAKEEKELLALGAGNPLPVSEHENIISQFRDMVAKYGDHEAISWDGKAITYAALDERSEQLAAHLIAHGLTSRQVAGVMMERSPDVVIAILAILKAGAAYLPIDPQLPESRIKTMLDSTQSGMVVINESTPAVSYLDAQLIDMSAAETWTSQGDCKDIAIAPEDLCYILYTSGSTGAPKGAQIRHGSVVNLIRSLATRYEMDPTDDKILLFSNIVFDASVMQMWLALLHGNTLVIPPYETLLEENAFNSMLEDRGVTHLFMTPSFLENIDFQANTALKRIEIGGEALKPTLLAKIPREVLLYNCYGPTEATVMASNGLVDRGEDEASKISLGAPLHHINLLILDQDRQMVPMGVPGELYIGGRGVGNGYINDPELTSKSFVPNPYAAGETIYRTGDIVCREKDGTISFVGRKDDQVKFRGYRLELGDIENSLRAMDFIKEALVILRTDFGQDYLAAYLIPDDSSVALDESLIARIKAHIASQLPPYMVPQHFTMMESFPLTLSGKLDKRKLPIPSQEADSDRYATATTETELQVRKIWSQVLNLPEEKISIDANFFTLGGHSLKAAFLVNSINEAFELDLSVKDFFARQDVKSFSAYIDRLDRSGAVSIPQAPEATDYPLSSAQRRLYFLHAFDGESMAYNMPQAFTLSGKVDLQKVEDALSRLVDRHESLRTAIRVVNGEPRQFIEEQPGFEIEVFESEAAALSGFVRPFDITSAPLFRAGFAWKNGGEALLQLDFHHIITDGVSQDLLIGEFITLYNGSELPPLPIQFKDYAVWQQGAVYEERIANQKQFWLEKYATVPEALQLPYDFARPEFPDYKGSFIKLVIDPKQVASLKEIAQSQQTTMYAVTLALYYLLMSRLSNSEDITVGTPVSGRELKDVEQMNGMFVNTLPLRTQVDYGQTFADFVKQTGQDVFACLDNQAYPFEELLEELKIERDASRNPLFDTMFSYQRVEEYSAKLDSLEVRQASAMPAVEQFDLSMIAGEDVDGMVITLQYATALFTQETINRFGKYFLQIVQSAVSNPNSKLVDIRMLPEEEESALLAQLTGPVLSIPKHQTMVGLFEDSVKANSNGIALVFHEEELTYKALDDKVNQVANYLMAEGAKPGDVIGLSLERGIYQLVSMLAILKAGAAYLPIHRQYPDNRVQFMFEENNVSIVLTDESDVKEAFRDLHIINPIADIDFSRISSARPDVTIHPKSLAYILYTSGSTGKPKGVRVIHKGVVNMACALTKRYEFKHDERVLQFSTIAFDASVEQIWLAYSSANTLVLIDELTIGDNEGFSRYISQQQVTHIDATPSFLETLQIPDNSNLKRIVAGGEVFTNALAEALNGKAT